MSASRNHQSEFRNKMEVKENGSFRGDMAATNTSVFRLGMNKRGNWNSKNVNKRKGFLEENYWWNLWAVRKNPYEFTGDAEMEISGINLKDINRQLEKEGNGRFTVVNSGPGKDVIRNDESRENLPENSIMPRMVDAGLKIINPNKLVDLTGDKAEQSRFFSELGFVPHWAHSDNYAHDGGIRELEEKLEPFEGVPIISKPIGRSGGEGIEFRYPEELVKDLEYEAGRRDIGGVVEGYVFQAALPVSGDVRLIAFGDEPVTAEVRYGRDDIDLHNLSQMDDSYSQLELVENGAADPVDVTELDDAYINAVEDIHELFLREGYIDGEETELWLGHDFLKVDPDEDPHGILESYPDRALDQVLVEDYRTENGEYLIFAETNLSPGYKIDNVNYEFPEQNSAINLLKAADDFSRGLEYQPFREGDIHSDDLETLQERYDIKV